MTKRVLKGMLRLLPVRQGLIWAWLGDEWAFIVLLSDGVSDVMSDQEVVDLCRGITDPTRAASKVSRLCGLCHCFSSDAYGLRQIVSFAEDVGA